MKTLLNYSLMNKKYYNLIWNGEDFWRNKNIKQFGVYREKENKEIYRILLKYEKDPQYYYSKSIYLNDVLSKDLIEKAFKIYFPYIGIVEASENNEYTKNNYNIQNNDYQSYFAIFPIVNLFELKYIPDYLLDINLLGDLTLSHHSKAMGIKYYPNMERRDVIQKIIYQLRKLRLIYRKGDINPFENIATKPLKLIKL